MLSMGLDQKCTHFSSNPLTLVFHEEYPYLISPQVINRI